MPREKHNIEVFKHSVQLEERIDLHKTGWIIQRVGWAFLILVIIFGVLGLFGEGVLSSQAPAPGNFIVKYDQYFRYESETKFTIESSAESIETISFPQPYLKGFRVVRFVPDPLSNKAGSNEVTFNFSGDNQIVTVYLIPETYGSIHGYLKLNNSISIALTHFIYP